MSEHAYVALRPLLLNGREVAIGEPIDVCGVSRHRLKQLVEGRKVAWRAVDATAMRLDATESPAVALADVGATPILHRDETASRRSRKRRDADRAR